MTVAGGRPVLLGLRIADPPDRWRALGFTVAEGDLALGEVTVELRPEASGESGIVGWTLQGVDPVDSIDGLVTQIGRQRRGAAGARP